MFVPVHILLCCYLVTKLCATCHDYYGYHVLDYLAYCSVLEQQPNLFHSHLVSMTEALHQYGDSNMSGN